MRKDGRTERHDEVNSRFFCDFPKVRNSCSSARYKQRKEMRTVLFEVRTELLCVCVCVCGVCMVCV